MLSHGVDDRLGPVPLADGRLQSLRYEAGRVGVHSDRGRRSSGPYNHPRSRWRGTYVVDDLTLEVEGERTALIEGLYQPLVGRVPCRVYPAREGDSVPRS